MVDHHWRHWAAEEPKTGYKIITLFSDGSGARLFYVYDGGMIDSDGDDSNIELANHRGGDYSYWAYLPDDFTFWCEIRSEDPLHLRFPTSRDEQ